MSERRPGAGAVGGGPQPHLALVGSTASGKSAIALAAARCLSADGAGVELVSVDSMQVYRAMDVGTAKPTEEERAEIPHHLIDLVDPSEDFTLSRYQQAAAEVLTGIERRGHRALLVGGTGLYFHAVVDQLTPPGQYPEVRAVLDSEPSTDALYCQLKALDPAAASRIEPANRRRVVRALEVGLGSGQLFSSFGPGIGTYPATGFRLAGVWLPRSVVARRIECRFGAMVTAGLIDEVRALAARPDGLSRTARQALGYREVLAHLELGVPLDTALAEAVRRTRHFARRQRMWWRRDPRITWFGTSENPLSVLPALLGDWRQP